MLPDELELGEKIGKLIAISEANKESLDNMVGKVDRVEKEIVRLKTLAGVISVIVSTIVAGAGTMLSFFINK